MLVKQQLELLKQELKGKLLQKKDVKPQEELLLKEELLSNVQNVKHKNVVKLL
ncbi:MAG: hypothetical protein MJ219_01925 [Mycoplasmoidaceae bacterium]|nr:hypothetical protein [Mycoplasmoidaceae bacterium]